MYSISTKSKQQHDQQILQQEYYSRVYILCYISTFRALAMWEIDECAFALHY